MYLIYVFLFSLAGIIWGDWKNWRKYYPTILFFIMVDLLYNFLFFNYSMWIFHETVFGENILNKHTYIVLIHFLFIYPMVIFIFLGRFPTKRKHQVGWILVWTTIFIFREFINLQLGLITHHNGWNIWWSLIFDIVMFCILRLHFKNPMLAMFFSFIWVILLWNVFHISTNILK